MVCTNSIFFNLWFADSYKACMDNTFPKDQDLPPYKTFMNILQSRKGRMYLAKNFVRLQLFLPEHNKAIPRANRGWPVGGMGPFNSPPSRLHGLRRISRNTGQVERHVSEPLLNT